MISNKAMRYLQDHVGDYEIESGGVFSKRPLLSYSNGFCTIVVELDKDGELDFISLIAEERRQAVAAQDRRVKSTRAQLSAMSSFYRKIDAEYDKIIDAFGVDNE